MFLEQGVLAKANKADFEKNGLKLRFNIGLECSRRDQLRQRRILNPHCQTIEKWLKLLPKQNQEARLDDTEARAEKKSFIPLLRIRSSLV